MVKEEEQVLLHRVESAHVLTEEERKSLQSQDREIEAMVSLRKETAAKARTAAATPQSRYT